METPQARRLAPSFQQTVMGGQTRMVAELAEATQKPHGLMTDRGHHRNHPHGQYVKGGFEADGVFYPYL